MTSDFRESDIEAAVTRRAEALGWLSFKWVSPGNRGVPDRLYFKNGKTIMVEFKTPSGRLSALQKAQIKRLRAAGIPVYVINSIKQGANVFT